VWFHFDCRISDSYQVGKRWTPRCLVYVPTGPRVVSLTNKLTRCPIIQHCCSVDWEGKYLTNNLTRRARLSLALPVDCGFRSSLSACVCHPPFLNATTTIAFASKRLLSALSQVDVVLLVVVVLLEVSLSTSDSGAIKLLTQSIRFSAVSGGDAPRLACSLVRSLH